MTDPQMTLFRWLEIIRIRLQIKKKIIKGYIMITEYYDD